MGERSGSSGKTTKKKKTLKTKSPFTSSDNLQVTNLDKKIKIIARNKKRKVTELPEAEKTEFVVSTTLDDFNEDKNSSEMSDKKKKKKKRNRENRKKDGVRVYVPQSNEVGDDSNQQTEGEVESETTEVVISANPHDVDEGKNSAPIKNEKKKKKKREKENSKKEGVPRSNKIGDDSNQQSGKSKSASQLEDVDTLLEDDDEVHQISSGDEDETTGMKRWITKYHRARPGAEVLMESINDFLVDYWAQKETERKEREAAAAEGGWTVVTHIKGRKKTTDVESGTTVGSVAQAAVMDNISKKKNKQVVGINFYRFQQREAQRNEIMMLQSKFEQDKKRIQQLRAARKFRPY